jgi:O-acetyl-ADP-ribose deacetylase
MKAKEETRRCEMPFDIQRNDVTEMDVYAIVNSTGQRPLIGQGVDKRINDVAGPMLFKARQEAGVLNVGEPVITKGYDLKAAWVIHVAAPVYIDGRHQEEIALYETYMNVLRLARHHQMPSIAFPLMSSGNLGFPKGLALESAMKAIRQFLQDDEMMIYLIVYDERAYQASLTMFDRVQSYLDEIEMELMTEFAYDAKLLSSAFLRQSIEPFPDTFDPDESFVESLFEHIDRLGLDDVFVYKKANVDRKLFSKMKSQLDYQPSKRTALAFALALELDLKETQNFIAKAGYVLSKSSKFDLIIRYMIEQGIYDLYEVNKVLFGFDQKTLGSWD